MKIISYIFFIIMAISIIFLLQTPDNDKNYFKVHMEEIKDTQPNTLDLTLTPLTIDKNTLKTYFRVICNEYDVEYEMVMAIAMWETGRFTSNTYFNKNNVGGIFRNGKLVKFDTVYEGIEYMVRNLRYNYFDKGLTTFELIQKKYCPVGAKNDPNGLNKHWLNGVKKMYKEIKEENK